METLESINGPNKSSERKYDVIIEEEGGQIKWIEGKALDWANTKK